MSKKSQDKRKAHAKEKAAAARKQRNASPFSMLVDERPECWIMGAEEDTSMKQIMVFRNARTGGKAAAFFLIDFACIGIKDAYYVLDASYADIMAQHHAQARNVGANLERVPDEQAREIVTAALRWTQQNHFRLPEHLPRCLTILGGTFDTTNADVSQFGDGDGGLFYEGFEKDLRKRLIDTTLDEFLARPDVTFSFAEDENLFDEEDASPLDDVPDDMNAAAEMMNEKLADAVRQWCFSQGIQPHEDIGKAIAQLTSMIQQQSLPRTPVNNSAENDDTNQEDTDSLASDVAMAQVHEFLNSFATPEAMMKSLGLENPDDQDE